MKKNTEILYVLGDALRAKRLVSTQFPGGFVPFALIDFGLVDTFLAALSTYQPPKDVLQ